MVQQKVARELQWLFREQMPSDLGIDAQIEVLRNGKSSGRLLALQIKSGDSYFREQRGEGIVYRDDQRHLEYWLNHSLPVVLVICRPETGEAYWQNINSATAVRTSFGCKILVPFENRFDSSAAEAFAQLASAHNWEARGEIEIPWSELLQALGTAAQSGAASATISRVTYECRRLASSEEHSAILVGAESMSPEIAVLRAAGQTWFIVGHVPVLTRGAETLSAQFIPGIGGVAFVVRAPASWGTGTALEMARWYWVEDEIIEVLRYPTSGYVVGWGLAFDRFMNSQEDDLPQRLADGSFVHVAFTIRYTPPGADPDGPEAIELHRTLSVVWQASRRMFVEASDSELAVDDPLRLYQDTDASFVAGNVDVITTLGHTGAEWAQKWIRILAENSFPTDRDKLLDSIRFASTG